MNAGKKKITYAKPQPHELPYAQIKTMTSDWSWPSVGYTTQNHNHAQELPLSFFSCFFSELILLLRGRLFLWALLLLWSRLLLLGCLGKGTSKV